MFVADTRGTKSCVLERGPEIVCASLKTVQSYRLLHGGQVVLQVVYECIGLHDARTGVVKQSALRKRSNRKG